VSEQVYRLELTERERTLIAFSLRVVGFDDTEFAALRERLLALEPVGADGEGA
jgi:hypothetical protein